MNTNKANIFFFSSLFKPNPLILELAHEAEERGYHTQIVDLFSAKVYFPKMKRVKSLDNFWWAPLVLRVKYVRRLFIPMLNRAYLHKNLQEGDTVNIHFLSPVYLKYLDIFENKGVRITATIWGSDYLRADEEMKKSYQSLFTVCSGVSMVDGVRKLFAEEYPELTHKLFTTFFGLNILKQLSEITEEEIKKFRQKYYIINGQAVVSIGYNGSIGQQHLSILDIMKKLPIQVKQSIFLLVPATYGLSSEYKLQLEAKLSSTGISNTMITERLTNREVAILRNASSVVINMQKTDAFAGSISESIAAGNVTVVGDWLPYDIYDRWGVYLERTQFNQLASLLTRIILNLPDYLEKTQGNSRILLSRLSWDGVFNKWEALWSGKA